MVYGELGAAKVINIYIHIYKRWDRGRRFNLGPGPWTPQGRAPSTWLPGAL